MGFMRVAVVLVAIGCRNEERFAVIEGHLGDVQQRVGRLELETPPPAWHCSSERCARAPFPGSEPRALAWCRMDADGPTGCRATPGPCGAGCIGVR